MGLALLIYNILSFFVIVDRVKNLRIPYIFLILNIGFGLYYTFKDYLEKKESEIRIILIEKENEEKEIKENYKYYCTGTYYNPCAEQCDENFLLTASNDSIDIELLNMHKLRWTALSCDLFEEFNYDDTIIVESENYRINGEWIVKDKMNKRWNRRVDFLVPFNDTLQIGKANITIRKK